MIRVNGRCAVCGRLPDVECCPRCHEVSRLQVDDKRWVFDSRMRVVPTISHRYEMDRVRAAS